MINTEGMVAETATKIFTDLCPREVPHQSEAGQYPQALWDALAENGLPLAWVSEANGGFGADYDETFGAIWASAQAASPVPFAETLIVNWMLDRAGLEPADGSASFALSGRTPSADIPFGMHADKIVLFDAAHHEIGLFDNRVAVRSPEEALSPDGMTQFVFSGHVAERAEPVDRLCLAARAVRPAIVQVPGDPAAAGGRRV